MKVPQFIRKAGRRGREIIAPIGNPRTHLVSVVAHTGKELHFTNLAIEQLKEAAQKTIQESWHMQ